MRITRDTAMAYLNVWLLPELVNLCYDFAAWPTLNLLTTVPNLLWHARGLAILPVAAQTQGHEPPYTYLFPCHKNVRHLDVRSAVVPTQVTLEIGGTPVLAVTLSTANEWTDVGGFAHCNVLPLEQLTFQSVRLEATQPLEIAYEQVRPFYKPEGLPFDVGTVFQQIHAGNFPVLCYQGGMGRIVGNGSMDPAELTTVLQALDAPHEPAMLHTSAFYRQTPDPDRCIAVIRSVEDSTQRTTLQDAGFRVSNMMGVVCVCYCECPTTRREELLVLVRQVDPRADVHFDEIMVRHYDAKYERKERKRHAARKAYYQSIRTVLQAPVPCDPPCFRSWEDCITAAEEWLSHTALPFEWWQPLAQWKVDNEE